MCGVEVIFVVIDGIMYVIGFWSIVYVINVRIGEELWIYDLVVLKSYVEKVCCDVVNCGVVVYKGYVYVVFFDGCLIVLDVVFGKVVWEKNILIDLDKFYIIMGVFRVFKGKVIIGNGGVEYGVRGYIMVYDVLSGE